jgi:hypothetical protein
MTYTFILYCKYPQTYLETVQSHSQPICNFKMFKNQCAVYSVQSPAVGGQGLRVEFWDTSFEPAEDSKPTEAFCDGLAWLAGGLPCASFGFWPSSRQLPPLLAVLIAAWQASGTTTWYLALMYRLNSTGCSRMRYLSAWVHHLACSPCGHFSYMGRRLF